MKVKFAVCEVCGNVVMKIENSGVPVVCCGQPMKELVPNTVDAAFEKHLPVVTVSDRQVMVSVGSVEHPMTEGHWINTIILETNQGIKVNKLQYTDKPVAFFSLNEDEKAIAAYEYCNLHGFWKTEIDA